MAHRRPDNISSSELDIERQDPASTAGSCRVYGAFSTAVANAPQVNDTDLLASETEPIDVAFRPFNALSTRVLNIGRLGTDVGALVDYYIGATAHDECQSSQEAYYMKSDANGRWVGTLRHELGVDGCVEEAAFRALLEGRHPASGHPLTPGAIESHRRRIRVRLARQKSRKSDWLSVSDVADRLEVSSRQVRYLLERGHAMGNEAEGNYLRGDRSAVNRRGPGRSRWRVSELEVRRFEREQARVELRPGFDLTLRPPKSVSILWALGEAGWSDVVAQAHREAVDEVVSYYEASAIYSRKRVDGEQMRITTEGMIGAAFDHRTSRAGDPLLHTHVVTFNMTKCSDGEWRSLDGTSIYDHAKAGGYLYQAHLRNILTERLGVRWTEVVNGCAEIEGIPRTVIDLFSKRRDEIECAVAEAGYSSAAAHQTATLETRRPKVGEPEPPVALAQWWEQAESVGFSAEHLKSAVSHGVQTHHVDDAEVDAIFVDLLSPTGLSEMASTFTEREVIQAIAERMGNRCTAAEVRDIARRFVEQPNLVRVDVAGRDGNLALHGSTVTALSQLSRYSTPELVEKERDVIAWADAALRAPGAVAKVEVVERNLHENRGLTDEQINLVMAVTTSGSRLHLVAGTPGSGKTYAAKVAVQALAESGVPVVGVALSAEAGAELEASLQLLQLTGRASSTISSLQVELDHPQYGGFQRGTVLIVDEASMVGTRAFHHLIHHLDRADGTLVLIGDPNQHGAVAAGGVYQHLVSKYPTNVIGLRANNRQVDEAERLAIEEFRFGRVKEAIEHYEREGKVIVSASASESYDKMVGDWFSDWIAGDGSPMLAGPNSMRAELNQRAHTALLQSGQLGRECLDVAGLEFHVGEFVVAKRNKRELRGPTGVSVRNGSVGRITKVDRDAQTVVVNFEKIGELTLPRWYLTEGELDYAYARTTYGMQGKTTQKTAYQPTDVSSFEEGYVALTRAKYETRIYVVEVESVNDASVRCCDYNDRASSEELVVRALERRKAKSMAHDVGVVQL